MKIKIFTLFILLGLFETKGLGYPMLLLANRKDIRVIDLEKGKLSKSILVKDVDDAASVDYYYRGQVVCWTDIKNEFIKCVSINNTKDKDKEHKEIKVIRHGITSPDGMAIDWVTEKLYWADSEVDKIEVAELFGPNRKLLYWRDLDQPRAIALVPNKGLMFWSDWGNRPKIERAGMNGDATTRIVIVDEDIHWPNGLTVDYEHERIYWADGGKRYLSSVDFDGKKRVKVVGDLRHPFALTYYRETLYWTDWVTKSIHYCRINKNGQCDKKNQPSWKLDPMYIHVYDALKQPEMNTPCKMKNGGCSHMCLLAPSNTLIIDNSPQVARNNTIVSVQNYSCGCPTGVQLRTEKICEDGPKEMLLLARRSDLRRISLDTPDYAPVVIPVSSIHHAIAVDYDPVEGFFYWTDDEAFLIQRARLNGSDQKVLVRSAGNDPDGIAIDWLARNLYWSDTGNNRIEVAKLDGSSRKILISGGLEKPRAIALHPSMGLMFWTDWGSHPKIERANLDGSDRLTIVDRNLTWPNGVALDFREERLYWVDASTHVIEVSHFDGSHRRVLLSQNLPHVFGFSLLGNFLYWTDWQKRSIERVLTHNASFRETLLEQLPDVMGLKALSMDQDLGLSPCADGMNGGCSHLCFNRRLLGIICDCPHGYELDVDNHTCIIPEAFLLYSQYEVIRRVSLNTDRDTSLPMPAVKEAGTLDYDSSGRLYWSDLSSKSIYQSYMNGSEPKEIIRVGLEYPEGLAIDWIADNVYWSDMASNRIEVSRLDGSSRRVILWDLAEPKSLAVDPIHGFLYWTEWPDDSERILKAGLDGSFPRPIVNYGIGRVNGLSIDYSTNRLYWMDIDKKKIESSDLNGRNRRVVVAGLSQPNFLVMFGDYLYWSDWGTQSIHKATKNSGRNRTNINIHSKFVTALLMFDYKRKKVLNPCLNNNGKCSHLCIPSAMDTSEDEPTTSYKCACPTHYTMRPNGLTCSAPSNFLIYSQKSSATRLVMDLPQECPTLVLPIEGMRGVRALAFDSLKRVLYWVDKRGLTIRRAHVDSHLVKPVEANQKKDSIFIKEDGISPFDLAVDAGTQIVYWSCSVNNVINATKMDGTQIGSLTLNDGTKPRSLAFHPKFNLIIFINLAQRPSIESLSPSGLVRKVIVEDGLRGPSDVIVDAADEFIYWIDQNPVTLEVANIGGGNRKILVDSHLDHPTSLTVHGNYIYWIDPESDLIERVHKYTGLERSKVLTRLSHLTDILSVSALIYKFALNHPCQKSGLKCSHLCSLKNIPKDLSQQPSVEHLFRSRIDKDQKYPEYDFEVAHRVLPGVEGPRADTLIGGTWQCDCPNGMILSEDGLNCIQKPICPPKFFQCLSGVKNCVPIQWRCDGLQECSDGSDETNCPQSLCEPRFFRCGNGECIDSNFVCDQTPQCTDASDEVGCCPPNHGLCESTGLCILCGHGVCPQLPAQCPYPTVAQSTGSSALYIVGGCASLFLTVCVVLLVIYYRRKPSILDANDMNGEKVPYRLVLPKGKRHQHRNRGPSIAMVDIPLCSQDVVNVGCPRAVDPMVGASSSSSSMTHYPRETENPPPTPIGSPRSICHDPNCGCHVPPPLHRSAASGSCSAYRRYKSRNRPPPPTPCPTDVCDDSDFCSTILSPDNSQSCYSSATHTFYDSGPSPPPPTVLTESCPPSPSSGEFIGAPCPSPLSPELSEYNCYPSR